MWLISTGMDCVESITKSIEREGGEYIVRVKVDYVWCNAAWLPWVFNCMHVLC